MLRGPEMQRGFMDRGHMQEHRDEAWASEFEEVQTPFDILVFRRIRLVAISDPGSI